jgi:hypothetical protein
VVAGMAAWVRVVVGGWVRAARDAGSLWDANPLTSLALGPLTRGSPYAALSAPVSIFGFMPDQAPGQPAVPSV